MKFHRIKLDESFHQQKEAGGKPWELRINDRDYQPNDIVQYLDPDTLKPWNNKLYRITQTLENYSGMVDGYLIFQEELIEES